MPERNLNFSRSGEKIFLFTTFIFKAFIYFLKAKFAKYGIQLDIYYFVIYFDNYYFKRQREKS